MKLVSILYFISPFTIRNASFFYRISPTHLSEEPKFIHWVILLLRLSVVIKINPLQGFFMVNADNQ